MHFAVDINIPFAIYMRQLNQFTSFEKENRFFSLRY